MATPKNALRGIPALPYGGGEGEIDVRPSCHTAEHCGSHQFLTLTMAKMETMLEDMKIGMGKLDNIATSAAKLEAITDSLKTEVALLRSDNKQTSEDITRMQEAIKGIRASRSSQVSSFRHSEMKTISIVGIIIALLAMALTLPTVQNWLYK